ncbi:FIG00567575: hypothetical protein [uncultured Synechococcales cyanobacterium]|uniref:PRC-barrel domain-containing protein n=1 Tax=uncultured Synechococcales cyanobacterium TaxID=1936017 RepID=A0A6J4VMX6_9CYAN|nr:FIG00567575: hypothetical protein [uncultured Synechococcales cyanobacterium]
MELGFNSGFETAMTISPEQLQQRSDLIGTQVITRESGKKLGVVSQLWVDVDQRQVIALGLRENLISGTPRLMLLSSVVQVGDVILVEDEDAIEDIDVLNYSTLIGNEVVTEAGELLGKVRGFKFDVNSGQISALVIASLGIPLIPSQLISTYELPVEEIVSSGPERLIVFEGAEERLNQLTVGVLERLGITAPPWEQEMEEEYLPTTSASNQLPTGVRSYPPVRRTTQPQYQYEDERSWEEEGWDDEPQLPVRPKRNITARPPQRMTNYQPVPVYEEEEYDEDYDYEDEEELEEIRRPGRAEIEVEQPPYIPPLKDEDYQKDAWADDADYEAPEINLPNKVKEPEYDRDPDY